MPTPAEIIDMVASLQNDTAQSVYNDAACLPYLNMALDALQEEFELNNVPVTNEKSAVLTVPALTTVIGFTTIPALPSDLIEIQQLWESPTGQETWIPVDKREFIPQYLTAPPISQFLIWAWMNQEIRLPQANAINDLKIDYIKKLFNTPLSIADINVDLEIINSKQYLGYKTAALCSMFIGENETRAAALNGEAGAALDRTIGISTKGRQAITTRRRPFRAGYKRQGI